MLTHWDDFFRPLDRDLRALLYAGDDLDVSVRVLDGLAAASGVNVHFPDGVAARGPWRALS